MRILCPNLNQYKRPEERVLICKNITFNELIPIPVYCDITEKLENLETPKTLAFDYTDSNFVNEDLEPELTKAIKMYLDPRNHIKCNCNGKHILCYENEDCSCYKMNKSMQALRGVNNTELSCKFTSQKRPSTFQEGLIGFYNNDSYLIDNFSFMTDETITSFF